jgi:tRNA(Ile)-lysidine synthase TilS/MesJ
MEQINMLSDKNNIEKSIERIKTFEPQDGYYLAFSGGMEGDF